jgi:hypothetical protein
MEWQRCSSTAISAFRHRNGILELVFAEGQMVYDYPCSDMLFEEFLVAPSKGRFVNGVIKPHSDDQGRTPTPRPFGA